MSFLKKNDIGVKFAWLSNGVYKTETKQWNTCKQ